MDSIQVLDHFVNVKPGEPYRLLPFGTIVKNGKRHELTPEYASRFRLPHFKPPVKLGSHNDETPAGGHIIGLEVRDDGLYAIPELNDSGNTALNDGHYRYHSPEILWEGAFEDPETGNLIEGPLIVGDALLHTPHLGERAALYSVDPLQAGVKDMAEETVNVPASWLERLFSRQAEPEPTPPAKQEPDEFTAKIESMEADNAALQAQIDQFAAEKQKATRLADIAKDLGNVECYGATFEGKTDEAATVLEGMTDEQRKWVLDQFAALSAQIDESNVTKELGNSGAGSSDDPVMAFNSAVLAKQTEMKIEYAPALQAVIAEQPELYKAYQGAVK